jgi:hypothetical protein
VAAWRALTCSSKPITRVPVPAGTDPTISTSTSVAIRRGARTTSSRRTSSRRAGSRSNSSGRSQAAQDGDFIIGITFSFVVFDNAGNPTDIDRNGKADLALAEIFYNDAYYYGTRRRQLGRLLLGSSPTRPAMRSDWATSASSS